MGFEDLEDRNSIGWSVCIQFIYFLMNCVGISFSYLFSSNYKSTPLKTLSFWYYGILYEPVICVHSIVCLMKLLAWKIVWNSHLSYKYNITYIQFNCLSDSNCVKTIGKCLAKCSIEHMLSHDFVLLVIFINLM